MNKALLASALIPAIFVGRVQRTVYARQPPPPPTAVQPAPEQPVDVVTEAPPHPQVEVRVAAPGPGFISTPGYWAWRGRWVWVGGRWVVPPRRSLALVSQRK